MITEAILTQAPWTPHLEGMDTAIATNNASAAVLAWRHAYAAALDQPGWRGLVEVAGAALRIGVIPGFRKAAESRARESYWTALFRARRQGSLNGVLDAAEAFGTLGDRVMVEQCIRIAERLALLTGDADAVDRVRALALDLAQRYIEVERSDSYRMAALRRGPVGFAQ
jgi:hypothetical protein